MINRTETEIMQNWKGDLNAPIVSICCITYNHEKYLEAVLDSFLIQETSFPFEIVIDDDCSPDGTVEIINTYIEKFPTIMNANLREENVGSMRNFTGSVKRSRGRYIAICEGDDFWASPLKLQKQVDFLEKNLAYSGCFHDCTILTETDDNTPTEHLRIGSRTIDTDVDIISLIKENNIATASIMFRNTIENFPEFFLETKKGDYALMILIAERGLIRYIPEMMSVYRVHQGGVWSSKSPVYQAEQAIVFFNDLIRYFSDKKDSNTILAALSHKMRFSYFSLALTLIREKKWLRSLYYCIKSVDLSHHHKNVNYISYLKDFIKTAMYLKAK